MGPWLVMGVEANSLSLESEVDAQLQKLGALAEARVVGQAKGRQDGET
jgi:hypothetical protein